MEDSEREKKFTYKNHLKKIKKLSNQLTGTVCAKCLSNSSSCCFICCNLRIFSSISSEEVALLCMVCCKVCNCLITFKWNRTRRI